MTPSSSRLLVVDDDLVSRESLSRRLTRRGYAVDVAAGGAEALERILQDPYDLILLDQMMPGLSGLDLLKLLRATYSSTELPVIMVTGVDQHQSRVDALDHGANDYIVKPVELPAITARIEAQLCRAKTSHGTSADPSRMAVAAELLRALERNELLAFYQPKLNLKTRAILGFEALLRWRHPLRGLLEPREFIPVAEETGLIVPAGEWILETACRQLLAWQAAFPAAQPLSMSVNLSVRQLNDPNLLATIRKVLTEVPIPPHTLKLELTESTLISEIDSVRAVLSEIQAMGVGLKLDDFGTGYSSLSYLSSLRFDSLKIDRSFVSRLENEPECRAIVRTIVALAHALNMGVVAEGIETERQLAELIELGCEAGQGFYFSRPVDADAAGRLLRETARPDAGLLVA